MSIRGNFNIILYAGQLFQHYLVDSYIKAEGNRLRYLREHQADLHVAKYNGLMDFLNNRVERENLTVGTTYILPSSFIGSPRAMQQAYQDSMAICAKFGKPTFFLTFTCNPKWTEITNSIPSYHSASDRPDVVARVYNSMTFKNVKFSAQLLQESTLSNFRSVDSLTVICSSGSTNPTFQQHQQTSTELFMQKFLIRKPTQDFMKSSCQT